MDSSRSNRLYGLDAIRGAAILLVLLRHSWPSVFGGAGIVGVVVFFALSGYLITGLLARDIEEYGRVRYKRFYWHRAFRLIPALAVMLAGFSLIEGVWDILGDRNEILRSVVIGLTYTMNVPGFHHGSAALSHLWTLATEEQFYLVWPLVLWLGLKRYGARRTVAVSLAAVLLTCIFALWVAAPEVGKVYTLPTSWASAMLIGAWARIDQVRLSKLFSLKNRRWYLGASAMSVLAVLCFVPDAKDMWSTYIIGGPLIAICGVVLIFAFAQRRGTAPVWVRPLIGLGSISYAAYLWNYPISQWLHPPFSLASGSLVIVLSLFAALLSWFLVECPAQRVRRHYENRMDSRRVRVEVARDS